MVDDKDLAILRELLRDSRQSTNKLSEKLDIPRATIHERIKKMCQKGVIRQFTIVPDHSKLGRPVTAFILVTFLPAPNVSQRELARSIGELEGVASVHLISGEYDILVKVRGESMESIGALVIDRIRKMEGVGRTITCSSFSCVKDEP